MMYDRDWVERFIAKGPDYKAERRSIAEMQALILKAGIGSDLPLGAAQDMAALAPLLMSDPQLLVMCVAALSARHDPVLLEGNEAHAVIEHTRIAMAAPVIVDALVCGADRVVLHDTDWPLLLWPVLAHAETAFDMRFHIDRPDTKTVMVTSSDRSTLQAFDAPQSVPAELFDAFSDMASKTYVPATDASRLAGAGAGLTDND